MIVDHNRPHNSSNTNLAALILLQNLLPSVVDVTYQNISKNVICGSKHVVERGSVLNHGLFIGLRRETIAFHLLPRLSFLSLPHIHCILERAATSNLLHEP